MKTFRPGCYPDMTNEDYHGSNGYSATQIITMGESMEYWDWKRKQKKEMTEALALGSLCHILLEQAVTHKQESWVSSQIIMVGGGVGFRTKACQSMIENYPDRIPVIDSAMEKAKRMVDAVLTKRESRDLFLGGISEPSVYVQDEDHKIIKKCKPDYLRVNDGLSINFKSTRDASYGGFIRSCADYAYDWQSAYYIDVLKTHFKRDFDEVHVCVESADEGPCRVGVYTIDDEDLDFARAQYQKILEKISTCEATGIWLPPPAEIQSVKLPNYAKRLSPYV